MAAGFVRCHRTFDEGRGAFRIGLLDERRDYILHARLPAICER